MCSRPGSVLLLALALGLPGRAAAEDCPFGFLIQGPDEAPIAGAQLRVVPEEEQEGSGGPLLLTDAGGEVELELPCDEPAMFHLHAVGFEGQTFVLQDLRSLPADESVILPMEPQAPVRGRVVDPRGRAIAGARVEATLGLEPYFVAEALTDDRGAFALPAPQAFFLQVWAEAEGHQRTLAGSGMVAGKGSPLEIVLPFGSTIRGRVLHRGQGAARVRVYGDPGGHVTQTGPEGAFELRGASRRGLRLLARRQDLVSGWVEVSGAGGEIVLELGRAGSLRLVVKDPRGRPVAGAVATLGSARVRGLLGAVPDRPVRRSGEHGRESDVQAVTDVRGVALLRSLTPGPQTVELRAPGRAPRSARARVVAGETTVLPVVLEAGHRLVVRLENVPAGEPPTVVADQIEQGGRTLQSHARADTRGRAVFEDLAKGTHALQARAGGHLARTTVRIPTREPVRLAFPRQLKLRGRVLAPGDEPVGEVPVTAFRSLPGGAQSTQIQAGPDGRFLFGELEKGSWEVFVRSPEWATARPLLARAGGEAIVLRVVPAVRLHGKVTDAKGEPVWRAEIVVRLEAGDRDPFTRTGSAPDGSFALPGLPPGPLWLEVRAGKRAVGPLELRGGPEAVRIVLPEATP